MEPKVLHLMLVVYSHSTWLGFDEYFLERRPLQCFSIRRGTKRPYVTIISQRHLFDTGSFCPLKIYPSHMSHSESLDHVKCAMEYSRQDTKRRGCPHECIHSSCMTRMRNLSRSESTVCNYLHIDDVGVGGCMWGHFGPLDVYCLRESNHPMFLSYKLQVVPHKAVAEVSNMETIREVNCFDAWMAERIHSWTESWL